MDGRKKIGHFPGKQNIIAALFCAACIALNMLLNAVAGAFALPLSLDTAGTITAAVMGGYHPGLHPPAVSFADHKLL